MLHQVKTGRFVFILVLALLWTGCAEEEEWTANDEQAAEQDTPAVATAELSEEQEEFWARLQELCGQAFRGEVEVDTENGDGFEGEPVMHVRQCTDDTMHIPFHIGDDRSRTWVLSKTDMGLRLKHDHRHEDGTEEEVTQYGGDTEMRGTATRQEFPADPYTGEMIPYAASNIWTVEIDEEDEAFVYSLRREDDDRRFRARFDLSESVEAPEAPWGYEDTEPTHN